MATRQTFGLAYVKQRKNMRRKWFAKENLSDGRKRIGKGKKERSRCGPYQDLLNLRQRNVLDMRLRTTHRQIGASHANLETAPASRTTDSRTTRRIRGSLSLRWTTLP